MGTCSNIVIHHRNCAKNNLSSFTSGRGCNGSLTRRLWPEHYQPAGAMEEGHDDAIFAPAVLARFPKPGRQDVQQQDVHVLAWRVDPGSACCWTCNGSLILFFYHSHDAPPPFCWCQNGIYLFLFLGRWRGIYHSKTLLKSQPHPWTIIILEESK